MSLMTSSFLILTILFILLTVSTVDATHVLRKFSRAAKANVGNPSSLNEAFQKYQSIPRNKNMFEADWNAMCHNTVRAKLKAQPGKVKSKDELIAYKKWEKELRDERYKANPQLEKLDKAMYEKAKQNKIKKKGIVSKQRQKIEQAFFPGVLKSLCSMKKLGHGLISEVITRKLANAAGLPKKDGVSVGIGWNVPINTPRKGGLKKLFKNNQIVPENLAFVITATSKQMGTWAELQIKTALNTDKYKAAIGKIPVLDHRLVKSIKVTPKGPRFGDSIGDAGGTGTVAACLRGPVTQDQPWGYWMLLTAWHGDAVINEDVQAVYPDISYKVGTVYAGHHQHADWDLIALRSDCRCGDDMNDQDWDKPPSLRFPGADPDDFTGPDEFDSFMELICDGEDIQLDFFGGRSGETNPGCPYDQDLQKAYYDKSVVEQVIRGVDVDFEMWMLHTSETTRKGDSGGSLRHDDQVLGLLHGAIDVEDTNGNTVARADLWSPIWNVRATGGIPQGFDIC